MLMRAVVWNLCHGRDTRLAALILLPFVVWLKQTSEMFTHWRHVIVVGLLNTAIPFCFLLMGLAFASALTALLKQPQVYLVRYWLGCGCVKRFHMQQK